MEFVTVLRHPQEAFEEERRLQRRQTIERLILFGLLLVSFVSQLLLHIQVEGLRADLNKEKQKVEDIITAKEIVLQYNEVRNYAFNERSDDQESSRTQRTVPGQTPHFELNGAGESHSGVFVWQYRNLNTFFRTNKVGSNIKEIQIQEAGMYRIHARLALNGRNIHGKPYLDPRMMSPAIGLFLMKRRGNDRTVLARTWKTQDDRGVERYPIRIPGEPQEGQRSKKYPLDTIEVGGGFYLQTNDVIYVQRADDSLNDPYFERFLNDEENARFEAYKYAD